jgi:hypothetical protein
LKKTESKSTELGRVLRDCLLVLLALTMCGTARAQSPSSVDTTKPIVVKNPKAAKPKPGKFLGQVLSSTPKSITVRSKDNLMAVRTFTYAESLSVSSFTYGENVEIDYAPGHDDIALRIKTSGKNR